MRAAILLAILLAGCSSNIHYVDDVGLPMQETTYGGDGTIHAIAVVMSFEVDGETHGHLGSHCGYDALGQGPSLLVNAPDDPERAVLRILDPDQDTSEVANFGTAMYVGKDTIRAAMDPDTELGTIDWRSMTFQGRPIRDDAWLEVTFRYMAEGMEGPVHVAETLHIKDLGEIPVTFDREEKMCM